MLNWFKYIFVAHPQLIQTSFYRATELLDGHKAQNICTAQVLITIFQL